MDDALLIALEADAELFVVIVLFVVAVEFGDEIILEVLVTIDVFVDEVVIGAQVTVVVTGAHVVDETVTSGELEELELVEAIDEEFMGVLDVVLVKAELVFIDELEVFERVTVIVVVLVRAAVEFKVKVVVFVSVGMHVVVDVIFVRLLVVLVGIAVVVGEVVEVVVECFDVARAATPTAIAAIIMMTMTTIAIVEMARFCLFIVLSFNLNSDLGALYLCQNNDC